jgi:glycopeptide antibiotics resistance protein
VHVVLGGGFVAPFVAVGAFLALAWMCSRDASDVRTWSAMLFVVYLGLVVSLTLFPITIGDTGRPEVPRLRDLVHLQLFTGIVGNATSRAQAVANILLGVPFGVLVPALGVRSRRKLLALGLAFPLLIEGLQLVENVVYRAQYRVVDVNDAVLNWTGVAIGVVTFSILAYLLERFWTQPRGAAT